MPRRHSWLLCALSGALMFAAAPPHPLGLLAFVSLIPVIAAVRQSQNYRTAAADGAIAGAVFFFPGLYWLTAVTALGWIALALYCATYMLAFALVARRTSDTRWLWTAAVLGSLWTVLEYVRGFLFTGFPWLMLSHTQGNFTAFTQVLEVIGSYGLSGVIVAINVLIYAAIVLGRNRGVRQALAPALVAAAILASTCVYGYARMNGISVRASHRVAAVQASVPQEMKQTLLGHYDPAGVLNRYLSASVAIPQDKQIDLIVWPETVLLFPYTLNVNPEALNATYSEAAQFAQSALANLARSHDAYLLVGATSYLPSSYGYVSDRALAMKIPPRAWQERYNSAFLLDPEGSYKDRYDKMHLVPFGEYVPLPTIAPFLARFVPFESSLIRGQRQTIFAVDHNGVSAKFGVLICYEDTDAALTRQLRQLGADYLVNISNDAWFGPNELEQHFVAARFRAIENRVGVLRAGNNGFTAVIDPFGRVETLLGPKDSIGHLVGQVSTTDVRSVYSRVGDGPLLGLCLAILFVFAVQTARRTL